MTAGLFAVGSTPLASGQQDGEQTQSNFARFSAAANDIEIAAQELYASSTPTLLPNRDIPAIITKSDHHTLVEVVTGCSKGLPCLPSHQGFARRDLTGRKAGRLCHEQGE
jgi:hypothetical protein